MAASDLVIKKGKTLAKVYRWETGPIVYKPISAITKAAPCRVTAATHGIPSGWRVAIVSVKGMSEINAGNAPPKARDYHQATVVDANTVEFNDINSADYKAYTSGGYLQYNTPVDLSGYVGRCVIKDKVGGTVLASTEAAHAPLNILTLGIDNAAKTITLGMTAATAAALTWKKGVFEIEMVAGAAVVPFMQGDVIVEDEVAT